MDIWIFFLESTKQNEYHNYMILGKTLKMLIFKIKQTNKKERQLYNYRREKALFQKQ